MEYGHAITLTITDFDVEAGNNCQYDALQVGIYYQENNLLFEILFKEKFWANIFQGLTSFLWLDRHPWYQLNLIWL